MSKLTRFCGALLGSALLAAGCGPDWDALDPALTGGSSSGSTGSTGSTGGAGGCAGLDDAQECTLDGCMDGAATHTPAAAGIACTQGGGKVCNGAGACVECLAPTTCPGTDDVCQVRSCDANTCGIHFLDSGAPTATQQPDDCRTQVCDGAGKTTFLPDNTDLPVDGKQCTSDVCLAGMASNPPVAAGVACSENGGKQCDGLGSCVQCIADADCGTTTACAVYACTAGSCPTSPNLPPSTPCGAGAACDGSGSCITCQPVTTISLASADVPQTAPINNGTATSNLLVAGTTGTVIDVNVTVSLAGSLAHSGDLSLTLVSPSGTMIDLSSGNGDMATGNFAGITFDDGAVAPAVRILYATFTSNVAIPGAIPERTLAKLNGEDPTGTWKLQINNAGSAGSATVNAWSLQLTTQQTNPALAPVVLKNTTPLPIPHGAQVTSTVVAAGLGPALYKATVMVQAPHPKSGQMAISLKSPSGKSILLTKNIGGIIADVFSSTTFDDSAPLLLGCLDVGCSPADGPVPLVVPQGALAALVGDNPNGTWTLSISDSGNGQTGTLLGWSLSLTPTLCPIGP